jgi:hypothetical protein
MATTQAKIKQLIESNHETICDIGLLCGDVALPEEIHGAWTLELCNGEVHAMNRCGSFLNFTEAEWQDIYPLVKMCYNKK